MLFDICVGPATDVQDELSRVLVREQLQVPTRGRLGQLDSFVPAKGTWFSAILPALRGGGGDVGAMPFAIFRPSRRASLRDERSSGGLALALSTPGNLRCVAL